MKTIAVIVALITLCSIAGGYEVGDRVYIVEERALGIVQDGMIGNISAIDEMFICLDHPIYVKGDELFPINESEMCLKKDRIAGIRVF